MTSQTDRQAGVPGWGRSLAAGALVGLLAGVVLSAADPLILAACGKLAGWRLWDLVPLSVAVLLPAFLAAGIVAAFSLRLARGISFRLFQAAAGVMLFGWVALTFAYSYLSGIALAGSVGYVTAIKSIVLIVLSAGLGYAACHVLARVLLAAGRRRRNALIFVAGGLLWVSCLGLTSWTCARAELPDAVSPTLSERPNVMLIVIDTLRADHMSCYGYHRKTTPNIDAFAKKARTYRNVLSPSNSTLPSHASFFTGLSGSAHGVGWGHLILDRRFDTLAEQLKAIGYQTVGISGNSILSAARHYDQGFEFYESAKPRQRVHAGYTLAELLAWGLLDYRQAQSYSAPMHRRLGHWFRRKYRPDKPFFIFLNYFEPHAPYRPLSHRLEWVSEQALARWKWVSHNEATHKYMMTGLNTLSSRDISELVDLYDETISYADRKVGELLTFLRESGLEENTLIIITSDHGEHFGEHHLMEHAYSLYEPLVRVPLIMKWGNRFPPGEEQALIQSHDLYPTILEATGIEWKPTPRQNCVSLLSRTATEGRRGVSELLTPNHNLVEHWSNRFPQLDFRRFLRKIRAIQVENMKVIRASDGTRELYDLASDPLETRNLAEKQPQDVTKLEKALDAWLRSFTPYEPPPPPTLEQLRDMSKGNLDDLRGLGYIK